LSQVEGVTVVDGVFAKMVGSEGRSEVEDTVFDKGIVVAVGSPLEFTIIVTVQSNFSLPNIEIKSVKVVVEDRADLAEFRHGSVSVVAHYKSA
jgi:hypothetical protein